MALDILKRLDAYTCRWQALWYALQCLFASLFGGVDDLKLRTSAQWHAGTSDEFAKVERDFSPVPRLVAMAEGVVLEIGSGTGNQLPRLNPEKITKVYGVEPNTYLNPILQEKLQKCPGLIPLYIPINCGFEDEATLEAHGIVDGSIDTVICTQVMCSVPDARQVARQIHRLLKPGGQLLFWEHQISNDGLTRIVQSMWNLLWTPLTGGCKFGVAVEEALVEAGPWEFAEMGRDDDSRPYSLLPRVWGRFIKVET